MDSLSDNNTHTQRLNALAASRIILCIVAAISLAILILTSLNLGNSSSESFKFLMMQTVLFALSLVVLFLLTIVPDILRARQTNIMLQMSKSMVDMMADGMTYEAAQQICKLLLPNTAALAVAITDTEKILGYAGYRQSDNPQGANIRTQATHDTLIDGNTRLLKSAEEIGLPKGARLINAAIIVPIKMGQEIKGTLKFYYKESRKITETQKSIAQGFGALISTQYATIELEKQRELATSMELKMLQSQINPHFLFNTINTIASLIRTDAPKARELLREFAVFYRSTLELSQDQIPLSKEIEQTARYVSFEIARFGDDRIGIEIDVDKDDLCISNLLVPPFLLQPLVENSVKHAMPAVGKLIVSIRSEIDDSDVILYISDDGVGMTEEQRQNVFTPSSQTGLGIAVKNVRDRIMSYFGPGAEMTIESELGKGTCVVLRFPNVVSDLSRQVADNPCSVKIEQRLI